jgi:NAD(P)-dependent dehydrogenase (short-subunit alcohol dehydrogenase family)
MKASEKIAQKIPRTAKKQRRQPGIQAAMRPKPLSFDFHYQGSHKLANKVAIITGGDSGIGRAVALFFAIEGADVVVSYLNEHRDAKQTKAMVEALGQRCLLISGDVGKDKHCKKIIATTLREFKGIDILVNNAGEQHPQKDIKNISEKQLTRTFATNVFSYFFMVQAALPYLKKGAAIINTTSVTSYKGNDQLLDYSSTKGAIVAYTRSLSESLIKKGIRVNGVAPGPIWTPLITSTFTKKHIRALGKNTPMKRPGQPEEVAPCYVFLASEDASYMSGQILHPNGGVIVNG